MLTSQLTLRLSEDDFENLTKLAKNCDLPRAELVRQTVVKLLEDTKKSPLHQDQQQRPAA